MASLALVAFQEEQKVHPSEVQVASLALEAFLEQQEMLPLEA